MDKQKQKKIDAWINDRFGTPNTFNRQLLYDFLEFAKKELGYRKLPKGKPPLLTIKEINAYPSYNEYLKTMDWDTAKRAVQRDSDVKFYGGK